METKMKFKIFKEKIRDYPVIYSQTLDITINEGQILKNQITRWQKLGLLLKLRRGLYILNTDERKINPSRYFLAGQIYSPSYISCETALFYYELIPEKVVDLVSVTTKKTMKFKNSFGDFVFRHLSPLKFRGFVEIKDEEGLSFFMALPEKAVVDFLYFNLSLFKTNDTEIFEHSYRFQNLEILDINELKSNASYFNSKKLENVVDLFVNYIECGRKQ